MFLRDEDIKKLVNEGAITNVADMTSDPDGPKSPVQPSSIDLTIGKIFVPGAAPADAGGRDMPKERHSLTPGETVVVETAESFHLPSSIGGFGFPPTSVSNVAVLVTNLGHIDPGYDGTIRFTLVNMGHEPYSLKVREPIYTLLLFKLQDLPTKDFRSRHPEIDPKAGYVGVRQELLNSLTRDFLDVGKRAEQAAKEAVTEELKNPYRTAMATGLGVIATLILGIYTSCSRIEGVEEKIPSLENKLQDQISELRKQTDYQSDIHALQDDVKQLKEQLNNSTPRVDGASK